MWRCWLDDLDKDHSTMTKRYSRILVFVSLIVVSPKKHVQIVKLFLDYLSYYSWKLVKIIPSVCQNSKRAKPQALIAMWKFSDLGRKDQNTPISSWEKKARGTSSACNPLSNVGHFLKSSLWSNNDFWVVPRPRVFTIPKPLFMVTRTKDIQSSQFLLAKYTAKTLHISGLVMQV